MPNVQITFHGTRGMIEEYSGQHKLHTCITVTIDGTKLCIDCGDAENYKHVVKSDALLLSHLHPDHVGGLVDKVVDTPTYIGSFSVSVKEVPSYVRRIKFQRLHKVEKRVRIGTLRVEFVPCYHSLRCPACAIYFPEVGLWVSTDIIAPIGGWQKLPKNLRVYVGDCSSIKNSIVRVRDKVPFGHANVQTQLRHVPRDTHVILTHLGRNAINLSEDQIKRVVKRNVDVAYDGRTFSFSMTR